MKYLSAFYFLLVDLSGICQSLNINLQEIELVNDSYFNNENQIIQLVYTSKTRYVSKLDTTKYLINLGSSMNSYQDFSYLNDHWNYYIKADRDFYYYRQVDSQSFKKLAFVKKYFNGRPVNEHFNLNKGQIPQRLYFLNYLPLVSTDFFTKRKYTTPKLLYQSSVGDTFIVEQHQKGTKTCRKLFLDKHLHIFRVEWEDFDEERLQEKWQVDLTVYPSTTLNHIGDSLNFGPFKDWQPKKKPIIVPIPVVYQQQFISIPLVSNEVLEVDTSQIEYFLVDFWYLGCKPCHLLRPYLEKFYTEADTNKIRFLGFNEYDNKSDVYNFAKSKSLAIPEIDRTLFDFHQFNFNSHPTVLILDSRFNIVKQYTGFSNSQVLEILMFLRKRKMFLKD